MKRLALLLSTIFLISTGCGPELDSHVIEVTTAPVTSGADLLVRQNAGDDWTLYRGVIEGFEPLPDTIYVLYVERLQPEIKAEWALLQVLDQQPHAISASNTSYQDGLSSYRIVEGGPEHHVNSYNNWDNYESAPEPTVPREITADPSNDFREVYTRRPYRGPELGASDLGDLSRPENALREAE